MFPGSDITMDILASAMDPVGCSNGVPDDDKFPFDPDFRPPVSIFMITVYDIKVELCVYLEVAKFQLVCIGDCLASAGPYIGNCH